MREDGSTCIRFAQWQSATPHRRGKFWSYVRCESVTRFRPRRSAVAPARWRQQLARRSLGRRAEMCFRFAWRQFGRRGKEARR